MAKASFPSHRFFVGIAIFFFVFTPFALALESGNFFAQGREWTNGLVIVYFMGLVCLVSQPLRWLMVHMVWLSYLGELLFCELLHWYSYRTTGIPLYVPFGHALVYATGYILAQQPVFIWQERSIRKIFIVLFSSAFLGIGLFLKDYFTLVLGLLFFLLLRRKRWQNLYFFIAVCVIFIELVGTYFQCWTWKPNVWGLPTCNPPIGAVFLYAGGDVLLAKIVQKVNKINV